MICKCGVDKNNIRSLKTGKEYPFMRYYWGGVSSLVAWERRRARCVVLKSSGRAEFCQCTCKRTKLKTGVTKPSTAGTFVTGRPREYSSNAERQRAYRQRNKGL